MKELGNKPLVTVIMPVYNAERYVREAIESILQQTYRDFVFLIINDGSIDDSESIILSYKDPRIQYVKNEQNLGIISSLNRGLDLVQTPYVARMDADDICRPTRLEKQLLFMENNQDVGVLGSWVETIGTGKNSVVRYVDDFNYIRFKLLFDSYMHHPTVMMRMRVLNDNKIRYPHMIHIEDYALWVLLSKYTVIRIYPEVLLQYRIHESSICQKNSDFQHRQVILLRRQQLQSYGIECTNREYDVYTCFIDYLQVERIEDFSILLSFIEQIISKTKSQCFNPFLYEYYERKVHQYVERHICDKRGLLRVFSRSIFSVSYKQLVRLTLKKLFK